VREKPDREVQPALEAARELAGAAPEHGLDAGKPGNGGDALFQTRALQTLHAAEEAQILAAGEHRVEGELLRHEAERGVANHAAARAAQLTRDDRDERGLAGAVRAEQAEHAAARDLQRD